MLALDRRSLISAALAAAVPTGLTLPSAWAAEEPAKSPPDVTRTLARYLVGATSAQLPDKVRKEGARMLLNWVAVAIGGSRQPAVANALAALGPFSGPAQASLLGRSERLDILTTAFINGVAGHVLDYDDTHLRTVVHPTTVVVPAMLAYAEYKAVSGQDFLNALILGVEVACRMGNSVSPEHYDVGWHITGTAGVFGAAAAVGKLMGLTEQQMIWALGLAASQPVGLRESFGSMNKAFNPGRAASNGLFAAVLASKGFDSSNQMIEAQRGWANTVSTRHDFNEITGGLGQRYEAALNTYKPFPCGIVIHPALDAALQLRRDNKLDPAQIESVAMRVNPLVLELTGKKTPQDGLESKFSVYHAVAAALIEGAGGLKQFSDRAARDPGIIALRDKVVATVDAGIKSDQIDMTITLKGGRKLNKFIAHVVGSTEVPMSDKDLEAKFKDIADTMMPAKQIADITARCWNVEKLASAAEIATAARVTA